MKTKTRLLWEEKLNKSNISKDDICDVVIRKAIESVQNISTSTPFTKEDKSKQIDIPVLADEKVKQKELLCRIVQDHSQPTVLIAKLLDTSSKPLEPISNKPLDNSKKRSLESDGVKFSTEKGDECKPAIKKTKMLKKDNPDLTQVSQKVDHQKKRPVKKMHSDNCDEESKDEQQDQVKNIDKMEKVNKTSKSGTNAVAENKVPLSQDVQVENSKPFNIMDHVSRIKVNGVGILFQCKLCNRNFLKRDFVISHGCAKTGGPKEELSKSLVSPAPPKISTVKYINTKLDGDSNKPPLDIKSQNTIILGSKPKPKIDPASKIKKKVDHSNLVGRSVKTMQATPPPSNCTELITPTPSRFKLVPGPNNTFSLVEEQVNNDQRNNELVIKSVNKNTSQAVKHPYEDSQQSHRFADIQQIDPTRFTHPYKNINEENHPYTPSSSSQPYPVTLIKSGRSNKAPATRNSEPVAFRIPPTVKPMYKVVQTDNPSKLLISSKPQVLEEEMVKLKKRSPQLNITYTQSPKQHKNVNPPKDDAGFFTFVNLNPPIQPSYVLPTATTQISKSTVTTKSMEQKDNFLRYSCNMCEEKFSREAKLLTHIQTHYNKNN